MRGFQIHQQMRGLFNTNTKKHNKQNKHLYSIHYNVKPHTTKIMTNLYTVPTSAEMGLTHHKYRRP